MKFIIALAFLALALAAPQGDKKPIEIISSNSEMNADGSYSFNFESADGTKMSESGNQKKVGPKDEDIGTVSKGSYSYTSPDGVIITANLVADENGFQATGDHLRHLPTPPPMPEHVVKMLADLKAAGVL
ncbi:endocuticle structural glycoprotein SgAbd-3-like [Daphnia carinata]|uniref:endocuticle structural glycoprotein SgAbd-3-like n=1 Tax=Daphnia carinata TaxID=120202 RepID=UPI00286917CB|nr:endocuticle structural glycoprotein SgAbd-3-like [Daphnia carinata]